MCKFLLLVQVALDVITSVVTSDDDIEFHDKVHNSIDKWRSKPSEVDIIGVDKMFGQLYQN